MGLTIWLSIIYLLAIVSAIISFKKGKKAIGITIITFMVLGLFVLGYIWFASPM